MAAFVSIQFNIEKHLHARPFNLGWEKLRLCQAREPVGYNNYGIQEEPGLQITWLLRLWIAKGRWWWWWWWWWWWCNYVVVEVVTLKIVVLPYFLNTWSKSSVPEKKTVEVPSIWFSRCVTSLLFSTMEIHFQARLQTCVRTWTGPTGPGSFLYILCNNCLLKVPNTNRKT